MNINHERERLTEAIRKVPELDGYLVYVRKKEVGPKPPINHKGRLCLTPGCLRETYNQVTSECGARGLCKNCYSNTRNKVGRGKLSWEVLEQQGLALPKMTLEEKRKNQSHAHRSFRQKPIDAIAT